MTTATAPTRGHPAGTDATSAAADFRPTVLVPPAVAEHDITGHTGAIATDLAASALLASAPTPFQPATATGPAVGERPGFVQVGGGAFVSWWGRGR